MKKQSSAYRRERKMKENNEKMISAGRIVWGYAGFCMMLVGAALFVPLLVIPFYPEEIVFAKNYIIPAVIAILIGALLFRPIYKKKNVELDKKYDYFIVVLAWIVAIFICACPFLLTGDYSFTESIFESTSGLTTTGLTVMDVDHLPHIYLLFRSIMLYVGGIGIILIMTSLFATTFGMRLYNAEGHPNKLIPNVIKSARMIVCIYTGYILMGVILYIFCGMPAFDAINHSIAAVANGGFSTRSQNIGYYHSISIEIVTMVLMILGGTNFLLNLFLLKGKFKSFFKHSKFPPYRPNELTECCFSCAADCRERPVFYRERVNKCLKSNSYLPTPLQNSSVNSSQSQKEMKD